MTSSRKSTSICDVETGEKSMFLLLGFVSGNFTVQIVFAELSRMGVIVDLWLAIMSGHEFSNLSFIYSVLK